MAITEMERLRLHQHFKGSMGEDLAATMMESLPPAGWGDVATKQDIAALRTDVGKDIAALRTDVGKDIAALRTDVGKDIAALRTDVGKDIAALRTDVGKDIEGLQQQFAGFREYVDLRFEAFEYKFGQRLYKALLVQTFGLATLIVGLGGIVRLF